MRPHDLDHEQMEALLGAFADGELDREVERSVTEHLAGCERCRNELEVQRLIAARLTAEPVEAAGPGVRERILGSIDRKTEPPVLPVRRRFLAAPWLGWAAAAAIALAWLATSPPGQPAGGSSMRVAQRIPMVEEALLNYRVLEQHELPVETRDPSELEPRLPFPVTRLSSPELRLLGAWTTVIRDEPAAVVAYRWKNRVVLQYVVSEELFFRQPVVRDAVAKAGVFSAAQEGRSVVAWPAAGAGSLIVGEVPVEQLERLRS